MLKKNKKNKKNDKKNNEKISRDDKVLVMLESMRDEIKLVAEGVSVVHGKLNNLEKEVCEFKNEMYEFKAQTEANFKAIFDYQVATDNHIELNFKKVFDEIKDIKKRLTNIEKVLIKNERKNTKTEREIKKIKKEIGFYKKQTRNIVVLREFRKLEKRVERLEKIKD